MNSTTATTTPCHSDGNGDLYGLGIRLGFYLQWASSLLVTLFVPEDQAVFTATNLLLHVAVLGGLVNAVTQGSVTLAEVLLSLGLLFGALSNLSGSGCGEHGDEESHSHLQDVCRAAVYAATAAWNTWLWFGGGDFLQLSMPAGCLPGPLMRSASRSGWLNVLVKVVSVCGTAISALLLVRAGNLALAEKWEKRKQKKNESADPPQRPPKNKARPRTDIARLVVSLAVIAGSVAWVEYLIDENELIGVYDIGGVGQLLPLLVGFLGLLGTAVKVANPKVFKRKRCWVLFGRHLS